MKYTPKEKQQIDSILTAFDPYIKSHPDFDILYCEKIGYVELDVHFEEYPTPIKSANQLLELLLNNIKLDVTTSSEFPVHMDNKISEAEKASVRLYFRDLLETLKFEDKDKPFFIDQMESFLEHE